MNRLQLIYEEARDCATTYGLEVYLMNPIARIGHKFGPFKFSFSKYKGFGFNFFFIGVNVKRSLYEP